VQRGVGTRYDLVWSTLDRIGTRCLQGRSRCLYSGQCSFAIHNAARPAIVTAPLSTAASIYSARQGPDLNDPKPNLCPAYYIRTASQTYLSCFRLHFVFLLAKTETMPHVLKMSVLSGCCLSRLHIHARMHAMSLYVCP
jgi:hypothetical protein